MEQSLPKAVLIAELVASRAELESVVSQVPSERMTEPGACGWWSVKDVLAHLAVENDWLALQLERRANERMLVALAALPESRLQEPDWGTSGRALGSVLDLDHDREHAQEIQRWLGQILKI